MADPQRPLLDLTTDQDRPTILINNRTYEIRTANDLTLTEYKDVEIFAPRLMMLIGLEKPSKKQARELHDLLRRTTRLALAAPKSVIDQLGDYNHVLIFNTFTDLLTPRLQRARASTSEASPSDGTRSSRASRGSTAAPPPTGKRPSRSGRSART